MVKKWKMKKWFSLLLAAAMCMGVLAGCGSDNSVDPSNDANSDAQTQEQTGTDDGTQTDASGSGTGKTPVEPYTDDDLNWTDDDSRVSREHEDESLRDVELVASTVDNFSEYETIYVGYPKIQYGFLSV